MSKFLCVNQTRKNKRCFIQCDICHFNTQHSHLNQIPPIINNNTKNLLATVIDTFGVEKQLDMVVEECAELIKAVNKVKRKGLLRFIGLKTEYPQFEYINDGLCYHDLCGEVADVEIMLEQMRLMLNEEQIDLIKERKLERLKQRIGYEQK